MRPSQSIAILPRPRACRLAILLLLFAGAAALADRPIPKPERDTAVKQEAPAPPLRVGQIIIVENETLPHDAILRELPLYPGELLTLANLRTAERNLERLGLFAVDRARGPHPRVEVIDPNAAGSEYKDILVTVKERPHAWLRWECAETTRALVALGTDRAPLPLVGRMFRWYWSLDRVLSEWRWRGRQ